MLFLALLFLPQARIEGKKAIRQVAPRIPKIRTAVLGMAILFVVVAFLGVIARPRRRADADPRASSPR